MSLPIWVADLAKDKRGQRLLSHVQRQVSLRIIRGYRTVAQVAACVLAGIPPLRLMATARASSYWELRRFQAREEEPSPLAIRRATVGLTVAAWKQMLQDQQLAGRRTQDAVVSVLEEWVFRKHGRLTYRITLLLTGNWCFASFLCRIGKKRASTCWFCHPRWLLARAGQKSVGG